MLGLTIEQLESRRWAILYAYKELQKAVDDGESDPMDLIKFGKQHDDEMQIIHDMLQNMQYDR